MEPSKRVLCSAWGYSKRAVSILVDLLLERPEINFVDRVVLKRTQARDSVTANVGKVNSATLVDEPCLCAKRERNVEEKDARTQTEQPRPRVRAPLWRRAQVTFEQLPISVRATEPGEFSSDLTLKERFSLLYEKDCSEEVYKTVNELRGPQLSIDDSQGSEEEFSPLRRLEAPKHTTPLFTSAAISTVQNQFSPLPTIPPSSEDTPPPLFPRSNLSSDSNTPAFTLGAIPKRKL